MRTASGSDGAGSQKDDQDQVYDGMLFKKEDF